MKAHPLMVAVRGALAGALAGGLLGCATAAAPPAPEDAAAYYPLALGWKWAYQVEKGRDSMLATYSVLERIAETAIVQAGDERLVYAVMPDGVARRQGITVGDYLLRTP